ncbi:MAG TPA: murein biosynthesis integral membrane protein MurJ [Gammaproteobacteria bacterium]
MNPEAAGKARRGALLASTGVVSAMTLVSRITGLARDIGFSHWFGAGLVMDAFFVAFKIPNLLRRFFAEGAFSQAFVPVLSEYRGTRTADETRALIDKVAGTLTAVLFAVTALGVLAAPLLILVFAPGFIGDDARRVLATDMLRLTLPYLFFVSLTAFAGAILNVHRRFAVPAFTPVLLNVVLILFAALVAPQMERPAIGLAAGVFAAGVVQLAFQLPFLLKLGLLPRPRLALRDGEVARVLRLMTPALFGSSIVQINLMLDMLIASFLAAGSISWLYYSDRLMEFPLGVVGIALGTVILPNLAEQHARRSAEAFVATLDWALRWVLVITVPAAVGLLLLSEPLLATIFHGGEFDAADVRMSAASLAAFAPGLIGFVAVKVLAPAYFARQDTRTPVRIGVRTVLINLVLNVVLVNLLILTGWAPAHAGLALATSVSGLCNAGMLLSGLVSAGVYRTRTRWAPLVVRVAVACAVMAGLVVAVQAALGDWLEMSRETRVAWLGVLVAGAVLVYAGTCVATGLGPQVLRAEREIERAPPAPRAGA